MMIYLFPWKYRGWMHQIPFLHIFNIHFCFHKMGRSANLNFWLPNISITIGKPKPPKNWRINGKEEKTEG